MTNRHDSNAAYVPLAKAIEIGARLAMSEGCVFTGVSGDFDRCSNLTRQVYEGRSAEMFGLTLDEYYALGEDCRYEPGTVLVWEPDNPHARCVVKVTETRWNGEERWVATEDICGGDTAWNDEGRVDEAAVLYENWKERPL